MQHFLFVLLGACTPGWGRVVTCPEQGPSPEPERFTQYLSACSVSLSEFILKQE